MEIAVSFGVGEEEVERKLKNLICHFSREIKKDRDSIKSGAGSDAAYKSKWFAWFTTHFAFNYYYGCCDDKQILGIHFMTECHFLCGRCEFLTEPTGFVSGCGSILHTVASSSSVRLV